MLTIGVSKLFADLQIRLAKITLRNPLRILKFNFTEK